MPKNLFSESLVFAVDLGGTHLRVALVDDNGRILEQTKQETPKGDSAESVVAALVAADLVKAVLDLAPHVKLPAGE